MGLDCFKIKWFKSWLITFVFICILILKVLMDLYTSGLSLYIASLFQKGIYTNISSKTYAYSISHDAYLVPITKSLYREELNDSVFENILGSGFGLTPFRTEKNEDIWIENGVQYRPFPFLEKKDSPYYTSEFEAYIPFNRSLFFEDDGYKSTIDISGKKIILWWQHKVDQAPIRGLNPLRACSDFPCVVTADRKYTENSSALIVDSEYVNREVPPKRRQDQVIIHYQTEAPFGYWVYGDLFKEVKGWNHVFNWTMAYRMDADITIYHGLVRKRRVAKVNDYKAVLARKNGLVAWMVSHCETNSKRERYVEELQKYIPVDIYGGCGKFQCPRGSDKKCLEDINVKYKFYLAFENRLCRDYITEKFFRYLDSDMIVVARGFNTYSKLLPSEIFINTADFNSTKDLANWLLFLDSNDQEYIKMLREKDKYFSLYEDYPLRGPYLEYRYESTPMCELCKRLWNIQNYFKVYTNISAWMDKHEYQCVAPSDV